MAVRAPPTCRKPVGEGAKRTRTGPWISGGMAFSRYHAAACKRRGPAVPAACSAEPPDPLEHPSRITETAGRKGLSVVPAAALMLVAAASAVTVAAVPAVVAAAIVIAAVVAVVRAVAISIAAAIGVAVVAAPVIVAIVAAAVVVPVVTAAAIAVI